MPYCPNCGAQVQQGSKFCSSCGNSLQVTPFQTPPPPPSRPAQTGEQVIASMSSMTRGLLRRENYVMLITQRRLIFVKLSDDDRKRIGSAIQEKAKADGAGLLGRIAAGIGASQSLGDYFHGWSPEQVSNQYGDVYSVLVGDVRELRMKTVDMDYGNDYELRIRSNGYNEKFHVTNYNKEEHQALKRLLGNRFKSGTWFL